MCMFSVFYMYVYMHIHTKYTEFIIFELEEYLMFHAKMD